MAIIYKLAKEKKILNKIIYLVMPPKKIQIRELACHYKGHQIPVLHPYFL